MLSWGASRFRTSKVGSWKSEVVRSNFQLQTPNFELPKFEVGSLKLEGPTSDFQLLTSKVRSWKSEVGRSNFQLQTSNLEIPKFEVGSLKVEGVRMHSLVDFRVSGLEVGDPLTCYLVSGLNVRIALILYTHQGRS